MNVIDPGTLYEGRNNILDLRFSRNFEITNSTLNVYMDLYNSLNAGAIISRNNTLGSQWGNVRRTANGRTIQFGARWRY